MALNVSRPYNPVWEQDYTEAAHSLEKDTAVEPLCIMHNLSTAFATNLLLGATNLLDVTNL